MAEQRKDSVRVYIYTAENGYAWQGCDGETADSLKKCIGNAAAVGAGGIRRGEVGGFNGTCLYRRSVRTGGDFAGRDSSYIALVFLPFAQMGGRKADFARLWNHPLLAQPIPRGESLENRFIDLSKEGFFTDAGDNGAADRGGYWTAEKSFEDSGTPDALLARLGELFQSRKTELGPLSAKLAENGGNLSADIRYRPFAAVVEEAAARVAYEKAVSSGGDERNRTAAFEEWKGKVANLKGFVNPADGAFRHFLGFRDFAKEEEEALLGNMGDEAEMQSVAATLNRLGRVLAWAGANLTGKEDPLFDEINALLDEAEQKIPRLAGDTASLRRLCLSRRDALKDLRRDCGKVAQWRGVISAGKPADEPSGTSPALKEMAKALAEMRGKVSRLEAECRQLRGSRKVMEPSPQSKSPASWKSSEGSVKPRGEFWSVLLDGLLWGVVGVAVLGVSVYAGFKFFIMRKSFGRDRPHHKIETRIETAIDGMHTNAVGNAGATAKEPMDWKEGGKGRKPSKSSKWSWGRKAKEEEATDTEPDKKLPSKFDAETGSKDSAEGNAERPAREAEDNDGGEAAKKHGVETVSASDVGTGRMP